MCVLYVYVQAVNTHKKQISAQNNEVNIGLTKRHESPSSSLTLRTEGVGGGEARVDEECGSLTKGDRCGQVV